MLTSRKLNKRKRIALVAHDHKKAELVEWVKFNKDRLASHELFATGTTGKLIEEFLGITVKRLMSGPLGGDQQIGSMIAESELDILIFFWDPMQTQPHDSDVKALLRLGVAWNIPMACDRATADFIMTSPYITDEYEALIPDYTDYLKRSITDEQA